MGLEEHTASLERLISGHLWVTSDFAGPASASLKGTRREVEVLLSRIRKLHEGLGLLPLEADAS